MLVKDIKKGLMFVMLLPLMAGITPSESLVFSYIENYYGPYDGSEGIVQMDLGYKFLGISSRRVKETLFLRNHSGKQIYKEQSFEHTLKSPNIYSYTFNVPTNILLNEHEFNLFYVVSDVLSLETLQTKQIVIYGKSKEILNTENNRDNKYEFNNTFFSLSGSDSNFYGFSETIGTANLSSYFANKNYYEFDLSNQAFSYKAPVSFKYKKASLSFVDDKNAFPYMSKNPITKLVSVSLELVNKGKAVTMRIAKNKYRFHPRTYEMTDKNLSGYEKTDRFYLPLGKSDELDGLECVLSFEGIGGNEVTILHKVTLSSMNPLFGDCSSSDYCVSGGVSND